MYLKANKEQEKVSPNILGRFEVIKNVRFIISRLKDRMKRGDYVFRTYKQRNQVLFLYLGCKLKQDSHG